MQTQKIKFATFMHISMVGNMHKTKDQDDKKYV